MLCAPAEQFQPNLGRRQLAAAGDPLVFSPTKRWLLGIHHGAVRPEHLQHYLDEFVFRFDRRKT